MCTLFFWSVIMKQKYIDIAIEESLKALKKNEVPVGCVIVKNDTILAKTHNLKEKNMTVRKSIIKCRITSNKRSFTKT